MTEIGEGELLLRLVLACVLGGIIGYERQSRHKSAGLRTNMLVCLGSCLVMVLSQEIYLRVEGHTNADPARLAAQVVSGIGFLGAGAIMKEGLTVTGLTTAACLWVVAGVGLAVGAGMWEPCSRRGSCSRRSACSRASTRGWRRSAISIS